MNTHVLAFSSTHTDALVTDLFVRGGYGHLPGVFLAEVDRWELWFPTSLADSLAEEGHARMLVPEFWTDYEASALQITAAMLSLDALKDELASASGADFLRMFRQSVDTIADFLALYSQTEFFYFRRMESDLTDWARAEYGEAQAVLLTAVLTGALEPEGSEYIRQIVKLTRAAAKLRLQMRETLNNAFFGNGIFMALMVAFERLTDRGDFPNLRCEQVESAVRGEPVAHVSERVGTLAVHRVGDTWCFETGPQASRIAAAVRAGSDEACEIRGTSASSGYATGVVCKFEFGEVPRQSRMSRGGVLVSSTIGPEFMTVLPMAGALVTDEGGLMSHAALLAREFGIPCVVGTVIATRALRTGDWGSVDAHQGVVRKVGC